MSAALMKSLAEIACQVPGETCSSRVPPAGMDEISTPDKACPSAGSLKPKSACANTRDVPCLADTEDDVPMGASLTGATVMVMSALLPCFTPPNPVLPPSSSVNTTVREPVEGVSEMLL